MLTNHVKDRESGANLGQIRRAQLETASVCPKSSEIFLYLGPFLGKESPKPCTPIRRFIIYDMCYHCWILVYGYCCVPLKVGDSRASRFLLCLLPSKPY